MARPLLAHPPAGPGARRAGSPMTARSLAPWLVRGGVAGYLGADAFLHGIPLARDRQLLWLALALGAVAVRDARRRLPRLVVDWLPFAAVLLAYDLVRGMADGLLVPARVMPQISFDQALAGGRAPTVWLQAHLFDPRHLSWLDWAAWSVYMSHFFATLVVAAVLWTLRPALYRRYVATVCLLAAMGLLTYVLFPAVPPWMAGAIGALEPTARIVGVVFAHVHVFALDAIFEQGQRYANDVAAMPSMHAAYAALIAIFLWTRSPAPARWALAAYALAMGFALVYTGEHYVVDILAGWLYAAAAHGAVEAVARRRRAAGIRSTAPPPRPAAGPARPGPASAARC